MAITIILEFLQLWHPKFLEILRESYIGQAILGNSFNWIDIIFYFAGFGIAVMWIKGINKIAGVMYHHL